MAFLDDIMQLSAGNFGSGYAKLGQEIKGQRQNETLVELYNKFKVDRNELLTTHEQVDALGKDFKGVESPDFNILDHMTQSLMKMEALTGLYQPFITSFATLGDDGVKVAERLTNELATKITLEERKGEIPWKQLQYDSLKQSFDWKAEQWDAWSKDEQLKRDSFAAADYIMDADVFKLIEAGDITTWKTDKLKSHNVAMETVINDAYQNFGGKLSKSAIMAGLKMAMDYTNKSFRFQELTPNQYSQGHQSGLTKDMLDSMIGNLEAWSDQWVKFDKNLINAIQTYNKSGVLPTNQEMAKMGQDIDADKIKQLAEVYKPDGKFMSFYTTVSGYMSPYGFNDIKDRPVSEGSETLVRQPAIYPKIIRPWGSTGFNESKYNYNPYAFDQAVGITQGRIKAITEGSTVPKGGTDDFSKEFTNMLYDESPLFLDLIESMITVPYNTVTGEKLKTTRQSKEDRR